MTRRIVAFSSWLTVDPNRLRLIVVAATLALSLAGILIPGATALADGGPGVGHIP